MTIKEIAGLANVSPATVSYVLNNKGRVSDETRDLIWKLARQNGYLPNANARNLVKRRNLRIGIIISDTAYLRSSVFFNNIAAGVIDTISPKNMDLVVLLKENSFRNWVKNSVGVDGAIVIDPERGDQFLDWMRTAKIPYVVIGRYGDGHTDVPSVDADTEEIAYRATMLLLEKGHRNILFNLGHEYYTMTEDHTAGIRRALAECKVDESQVRFCYSPFEIDENSEELARALCKNPQVTAVVCASDTQTMNTVQQLAKLRRRIPEDVSVVCLAGTYLTRNYYPRIASYCTAFEKMGELVAEDLLGQFEGKSPEPLHRKVDFSFDPGESISEPCGENGSVK